MKKIIYILISSLLVSVSASAYILDAKPMDDLLNALKTEKFVHKEDGLIFGFNSIKSCVFASDNFVLIKNYCIPKKDYPAKGYTIISLKFGIIDLYQEKTDFVIKQDIQISTFSDVLKDYLQIPTSKLTIESLNIILEKLYYTYGPACWSSNYSYQTNNAIAACNTDEVSHFQEWANETQTIVNDGKLWNLLLQDIESGITPKN